MHNRILVETAPDFELLIPMLLHGRFDLFPRGPSEIRKELTTYGERYLDLAVEQHLLLHYEDAVGLELVGCQFRLPQARPPSAAGSGRTTLPR